MTHRNRRTRYPLIAGVTALATTLLLGGCSGSPGGGASGDEDDGTVTIGVEFASQNQARWNYEAAEMKRVAEENGDRVIVNFANYSTAKQTSDVDTMIQQGIDVLILAAVDAKAGASLVTKVQAQGIPVITYDSTVDGATPDYFVQRNNYDAGKLHVEAALAAVPDGNYALIKGDESSTVAQGMARAYDDLLAEQPGVNIVYDQWTKGWDAQSAQTQAEAALATNQNDIDAFIVSWDDGAQGVVQAIKGAGIDKGAIFVTGTDAAIPSLKYIADGWQSQTVWTDIIQMAADAAAIAHDLGSGREAPAPDATEDGVPVKYTTLESVEKDNLCDFILEGAPEEWTTPDAVFGSATACG